MKVGAGALFVVIGLVLLWAAVTGRLGNLESAWNSLRGKPTGTTTPTAGGNGMGPAARAATERLATSSALNVPVTFPITPTFPFERSMHSNMGRVVS